jgi:c-di-GMP-binding flagellar brake protein YcgR
MDELSKRLSERIENIDSDSLSMQKLVDLSETGVCCLHDKAKEKGSVVQVEINSITARARVAYCAMRGKDFRLGLQFIELSPQVQKQIADMVDAYSKGVPVECRVIDT